MAIGKSVPMLDAFERVTGAVNYMVNLRLPDMLVGKIVRSTVPHGKLISINVDHANKISGVVAVVSGDNLETKNLYGVGIKDQPIVAFDKVRYIGEPVAIVAAEDHEAAEEAAYLVDIQYQELPAVFDAIEAAQPGAPTLHETFPNNVFRHAKLTHGDIEAAFDRADEIFEDTFYSPVANTASLEPHVSAAQWQGDRLTIWTAAQAPYAVRRVLADLFHMQEDHIRVIVSPLGGGYGGKGQVRIEPLAAAAAKQTNGRPVKIVLSREEEFVTVTKHAATITLKTGVKKDGSLTGREITAYWNGGAYADASSGLVIGGMVRSVGPYRFDAVQANSYGVYTNLPSAAAFRGAMSSQGTWAYESQMDIIANKMGWDPLEFRMKNMLQSGDKFPTGESMHDIHFKECLETVADGLNWKALPINEDTTTLKHGRGLAVMMKSTIGTSKSECRIVLDDDGNVTLYTSTVEMGQGSHTALAQITVDALGLPIESVSVIGPDTDKTPFDTTTSASRSTSMMGNAVMAATEDLLQQLRELAAPILEINSEELIANNGLVFTHNGDEAISYSDILKRNNMNNLKADGEYATNFSIDLETGQGISTPHWHQGAGAVEVSVDVETGKVIILNYQASSYAGKIINPMLVKLQNDGNVIFGLGPTLLEEMVFDDGQITNPNFSDYMIPSIRDVPQKLESVSLESEQGEIHGIGEMTLPPVAPAIAAAIEDAVGVRITDLPITAEKVLRALREKSE